MLVDASGQTMVKVVASVQQGAAIMGEIHAASEAQSEGIAQVNAAISANDQSTQQNAALVEQAAAASESLHDNATRLAALLASLDQPSAAGRPTGSTRAGSRHAGIRAQPALLGL